MFWIEICYIYYKIQVITPILATSVTALRQFVVQAKRKKIGPPFTWQTG